MKLSLEAKVEETEKCIWTTVKLNDITLAIDSSDKEALKLDVENLLYDVFGLETQNYEIKYNG